MEKLKFDPNNPVSEHSNVSRETLRGVDNKMEFFEALMTNGTPITFSALFIGLLLYVIKTNDVREERYQQTVEALTKALNSYEDLKEDIIYIKNKI